MPMASTRSGLTLAYDTTGSPDDPPLLLVSGLGTQLLSWDEGLCALLADAGRYVVRFDNRDAGLSTSFDDRPVDVAAVFRAMADGDVATARSLVPYDLSDMALDAVELLDSLGIDRAHVVGASMGGMIAQTMAIEHPTRVATLTSIMSTTGDGAVGQPSPDALGALLGPVPTSRDEAIERSVQTSKVIGSPGYPYAEADLRAYAGADFDRSFHPAGMARQLAAVVTQPDRTVALSTLNVPTLVVHGADDPLVDPSGGRATANAVPGAQLKIVPGMGHDIPPALYGEIVASLVENFALNN